MDIVISGQQMVMLVLNYTNKGDKYDAIAVIHSLENDGGYGKYLMNSKYSRQKGILSLIPTPIIPRMIHPSSSHFPFPKTPC